MYESRNHCYLSEGAGGKSTVTRANPLYRDSNGTPQQMWHPDNSSELHNDPFLARENYEIEAVKRSKEHSNRLQTAFSTFSYLLLICTLFVLTVLAVFMLWKDYVHVGKFIIETEYFTITKQYEFPPVTICNKVQFDYESDTLSRYEDSLISALRNASTTPYNFSGLDELAVYNDNFFYASFSKKFALKNGIKLDQFVLLCKFYDSLYACDQIFKPVYVPLLGLCYRSDISNSWPIAPGPLLGLDVYFYFDRFKPSPVFGRGALVMLGEHQGTENAIHISEGSSTSLSVREVNYAQKYSFDSHPCFEAGQNPLGKENLSIAYSVEACRNLCFNKLWNSAFGCFVHAGFYSDAAESCMDNEAQRRLTVSAQTLGHANLTRDAQSQYAACCAHCFPLCQYKKYEYSKLVAPMNTAESYIRNLQRNEFTGEASKWIHSRTSSLNSFDWSRLTPHWAHLKVFLDSASQKKSVEFQPANSTARFAADVCGVCAFVLCMFYTLSCVKAALKKQKRERLRQSSGKI